MSLSPEFIAKARAIAFYRKFKVRRARRDGDDWSDGHELYATKPKELYMPSQDSLSRRLGPVFAEVAAQAQPRVTMEQHKAEYRARPLSERLHRVFAEVAVLRRRVDMLAASTQPDFKPCPAKAYKPAHGGYPG